MISFMTNKKIMSNYLKHYFMEKQKLEDYLSYLCKMIGKDDVSTLGQPTIVERYILPRFVGLLGTKQRERGYVSDEFMRYMTKWGQYCFELDGEDENTPRTAYTLMLIAMQRILRGGVFYEKRVYRRNLYEMPSRYSNYAAWADKDMPMNKDCWKFLEANMEFCLNQPGILNEISSVVLRCLLRNLNATGVISATAPGYMWNEREICISSRGAYLWALNLAINRYGLGWCCRVHAPVWREKMFFFKKYRDQINWSTAWKYFSLEDEVYYTGWKRKFLKGCYLYNFITMRQIKKEIFST